MPTEEQMSFLDAVAEEVKRMKECAPDRGPKPRSTVWPDALNDPRGSRHEPLESEEFVSDTAIGYRDYGDEPRSVMTIEAGPDGEAESRCRHKYQEDDGVNLMCVTCGEILGEVEFPPDDNPLDIEVPY